MNERHRFLFHNEAVRINNLIHGVELRFYGDNFPPSDLIRMFAICDDLI